MSVFVHGAGGRVRIKIPPGSVIGRLASGGVVSIAFADLADLLGGGPGGAVWTHRGAYDAGTAYVADDVVEHAGSSYVATAPSTGSVPPSADWELVASKGAPGTPGDPGTPGSPGPKGDKGDPGDPADVTTHEQTFAHANIPPAAIADETMLVRRGGALQWVPLVVLVGFGMSDAAFMQDGEPYTAYGVV